MGVLVLMCWVRFQIYSCKTNILPLIAPYRVMWGPAAQELPMASPASQQHWCLALRVQASLDTRCAAPEVFLGPVMSLTVVSWKEMLAQQPRSCLSIVQVLGSATWTPAAYWCLNCSQAWWRQIKVFL